MFFLCEIYVFKEVNILQSKYHYFFCGIVADNLVTNVTQILLMPQFRGGSCTKNLIEVKQFVTLGNNQISNGVDC